MYLPSNEELTNSRIFDRNRNAWFSGGKIDREYIRDGSNRLGLIAV
jgi:hypothetical protein